MSDEKNKPSDKPADPYQRYKDFKWQNPEQFKNGPIDDESRKCRDCICCFIFILIFLLMIVVAVFGFYKGKPTQLFYFYDTDGNACGHDKGYEDSVVAILFFASNFTKSSYDVSFTPFSLAPSSPYFSIN